MHAPLDHARASHTHTDITLFLFFIIIATQYYVRTSRQKGKKENHKLYMQRIFAHIADERFASCGALLHDVTIYIYLSN